MNQSNNYFGQHLFSQITSLCSKAVLQSCIQKTGASQCYKQLKTYEHFIAMLYCVITGSTSLREIEAGLGIAQGKLNHLGIDYVPPRSTLSDGNTNRSSDVFKAIYEHLYSLYKPSISESSLPKAVLNKLFLLDATVFDLFKAILKTSGRHADNGKKKGGIKKNTVLHGATLMPHFIEFSAAADHDQQIFKALKLSAGSYLIFDKGYNNYKQFAAFTQASVFFITRQKENAVYTAVMECLHDNGSCDAILKEELIIQEYTDDNGIKQQLTLRRIAWWDGGQQKTYEFITNNFELDAATIAKLYQYRWQIELFFKKLKQNFPLQYFVGDNQNGWDTDQFPNDINELTEAMLIILEAGGFAGGGINFDAKIHRNSTDAADLFYAHIGGMDTFAKALIIAANILEHGEFTKLRKERYVSFETAAGAAFEAGKLLPEDLQQFAIDNGEPKMISGRQEYYENLLNRFI